MRQTCAGPRPSLVRATDCKVGAPTSSKQVLLYQQASTFGPVSSCTSKQVLLCQQAGTFVPVRAGEYFCTCDCAAANTRLARGPRRPQAQLACLQHSSVSICTFVLASKYFCTCKATTSSSAGMPATQLNQDLYFCTSKQILLYL
jgi:hypothetical protein